MDNECRKKVTKTKLKTIRKLKRICGFRSWLFDVNAMWLWFKNERSHWLTKLTNDDVWNGFYQVNSQSVTSTNCSNTHKKAHLAKMEKMRKWKKRNKRKRIVKHIIMRRRMKIKSQQIKSSKNWGIPMTALVNIFIFICRLLLFP